MIKSLRNYLAWRRERRNRYQRALRNATLMVVNGSIEGPQTPSVKRS